MSDADKRFHEQWLGMVQPSEGLVVSLPVLVDAQCVEKLPREAHVRFLETVVTDGGRRRVGDLPRLCADVLELPAERFDQEAALPKELHLYVPEGKQLLRPTRALRHHKPPPAAPPGPGDTPASVAARPYAMLVWEVPPEVTDLDRSETATGTWDYPAQAKLERLLRECRVPIGLLSNGWEIRLVYAPHGESSGWVAFRVEDMASVSGRPIFDAFVMLLSRQRWFGVAPERQLPALLAESRKRNADVTTELSRQVLEALEMLLAGFAAAEERDGAGLLRAALEREDEHLYAGLLSLLLRLVFLLYCEDRSLLPVEHPLFEAHYSLLGLFDQLEADHGRFPDTMARRFGAYPRLVSLFRAVFLGVKHRDLEIPARRGELFDPNVYPFLEGWGPEGAAPITQPEERAAVKVPSVDDGTIFTVLHKLLFLNGQRLSYKALDVEQIGSVYEALMGFSVMRLDGGAVRIKLGSKKGAARVWVEAHRLLGVTKTQRASWLSDELGFDNATAKKIVEATSGAATAAEVMTALEPLSGRRPERAEGGTLVIQPGPERRRTSSHYTPRELTEPIVARTLEPLIAAMGPEPSSGTLLSLVICDPAMGSGAFLVAACRYLADRVVAAWTREGKLEVVADAHEEVVNHARRLVAQRCLYGVDKNRYAVRLARLSLWLVTMARREPFTFVDHALRHGDSLVGLSFDQIRSFHWKAGPQAELTSVLLKEALDEAIGIRKQILDLAAEGTWAAQREKERLLFDAEDAIERVRLIGDLVVGAFFGKAKDKEREAERLERLKKVELWLAADKRGEGEAARAIEVELKGMQAELRQTQVPFHWMAEFPEVFWAERPDPLDGGRVNGAAFVDAFVGNPPYIGSSQIAGTAGAGFLDCMKAITGGLVGKADYSVFFFLLAERLIGHHGVIGFVATKTIYQGASREVGLQWLLSSANVIIYRAQRKLKWEGDANVTVSVVHLARGLGESVDIVLDGQSVRRIDSRLRPRDETSEASPLRANDDCAFQGLDLYGSGFVLSEDEAKALLVVDPSLSTRVRRRTGGEHVNGTSATVDFAIFLSDLSLEMAEEQFPLLLKLVKERVRPQRAQLSDTGDSARLRREWWRYNRDRPELRKRLATLQWCWVTSIKSKHRIVESRQADEIFTHNTYVFPNDSFAFFAVVQSRVHSIWAAFHSSTLEDRPGYSPSKCFVTFPFPARSPDVDLPELTKIGKLLWLSRTKYATEQRIGLTDVYNRITEASEDFGGVDDSLELLRGLHEKLDRAVLRAYGWEGLPVPPFTNAVSAESNDWEDFQDEIIDRLFVLNAARAEEERRAAPLPIKKGARKPAAKKPAGSPAAKRSPRATTTPTLPGFEDDDS